VGGGEERMDLHFSRVSSFGVEASMLVGVSESVVFCAVALLGPCGANVGPN